MAQAISDWQTALLAGSAAYEQGQFSEALRQWQQALAAAENRNASRLTTAFLQHNLSVAHRQLGQTAASQSALAEAQAILADWPARDLPYWEVSARVLNTQGQHLWENGDVQAALSQWQAAEDHYRQAELAGASATNGRLLSQINQAIARQSLGLNAAAVRQLMSLRPDIAALPAELQLEATRELGRALRRVGELSAAETALTSGLSEMESAREIFPFLTGQILLELGHTLRQQSHREKALGRDQQAAVASVSAQSFYREAADAASAANAEKAALLRTQAQLNQLSYLIEQGDLTEARSRWQQIDLSGLPIGRASVEAHISYAHSLNCLQAPTSTDCLRQEWQDALSPESIRAVPVSATLTQSLTNALARANQQAQNLSDPLLVSYALGELGHTYELARQWPEALQLTQSALAQLEGKQLPEIAYRWEWQLGRIYRAQSTDEDRQVGIAYRQAIASLSAVRQNLLTIDPQAQFSFRDGVEPLYREYVSWLLGERTQAQIGSLDAVNNFESGSHQLVSEDTLRSAIETIDALQLVELENFLGCSLSQLVNLGEGSTDPLAAKLYPILLPDRLALIFEIPGEPLALQEVAVEEARVEQVLSRFRENLTLPGKTPEVLTDAQQLYRWLIEPIAPALAAHSEIETLVFVLDGALRNIPMGVLYDGEQYLIEKDYAIAIAPQLDLFAPRPTPQLKILRGGIGLPQTVRGQRFPEIELVRAELEQIPDALTVAPPLLDESFTEANIEQQLSSQDYSAIHWKTHGVFSSDPTETFLVAFQDGITANELSELVQSATAQRAEPLELLVLSACETALGDRQAVLGLAGIAVRAGARSTVSTLWRAEDRANTLLMSRFYDALTTGVTKARALQLAQQSLIAEEGYPAPYYWAPYVLIGNWL